MDSSSDDSLSEDRSYFASMVMPDGVAPDDRHSDGSLAARARLVGALVGAAGGPSPSPATHQAHQPASLPTSIADMDSECPDTSDLEATRGGH